MVNSVSDTNYERRHDDFIELDEVTFSYGRPTVASDKADGPSSDIYDRDNAVEDVNLSIGKGEFIVFLGRNGSGKSPILPERSRDKTERFPRSFSARSTNSTAGGSGGANPTARRRNTRSAGVSL
jgi:hypothetical protein